MEDWTIIATFSSYKICIASYQVKILVLNFHLGPSQYQIMLNYVKLVSQMKMTGSSNLEGFAEGLLYAL